MSRTVSYDATDVGGETNRRRLPVDYRKLHSWFFLLTLGLAPLPLGSIHPWSLSILAILVSIQLVVLLPSVMRDEHDWHIPKSLWLAALLMGGVILWIEVQYRTGTHADLADGIWVIAQNFGLNVEPRIAMAAEGSEFGTLRLMTALGVFLIAFALAQSRRRASALLTGLFWIALIYAVIGLVQLISGWRISERIAQGNLLQSTFVNRNHAATFLNIGLLIGLAKLIEPAFRTVDYEGRRDRWSTMFVQTIKSLFEERPFLTLNVMLLFVSSLATLSRGGFLSLVVAAAALTIIGLRHIFLTGGRGWFILGATIVIGCLLVWLGGEGLLRRFDDIGSQLDAETAGRIAIYGMTIELISERPWTGYGFGAFDQLFALNRDERFFLFFDYVHNDWLELAVEVGLPAAMALWIACGLTFLICVRGAFQRKQGRLPALVACTVWLLIAIHALVDFSLAMPAIMIWVAAVVGIGCAQAKRKTQAAKH